ncbi:hypothetical protein ABL78_0085 [Leptomonas seymouri]|uniref:Uncharacterized protein n=1 Tax=Leptomonas seymouri TaxID=5684 RepID=A0A0N1I2K5_LEPSE|nr:hypothetical protein ABL78_0085 [Leptomonas seymouri]|eukprot:KPI90852.1 hypothetical protein ABL78_0085 [Leptomonas seymouri]
MSNEKTPRFLQQTTSQLLHQQEALRKRREMLERESTKPPAMRFGTSSPPRGPIRVGKSPVPPSVSSQSTPTRGDNVHRELNWSRAEDESLAERAPMRFSMTFRPTPAPVMTGRPRSATGLHIPPSPSPREVNTTDYVNAVKRKMARGPSTPRTVSPRSPPLQRTRAEDHGVVAGSCNSSSAPQQNAPMPVNSSVQESGPLRKIVVEPTEACAANIDDAKAVEEREMTRAEKLQSLPLPPPPPMVNRTAVARSTKGSEERVRDTDATGIAGFSNTFAVPRFVATTPMATWRHDGATQWTVDENGDVGADSTPGRPAVGEFRTPRPVTPISNSLTPIVPDIAVQTNSSSVEDEGLRNFSSDKKRYGEKTEGTPGSHADDGGRDSASPAPSPSHIVASLEASATKRRGLPTAPAVSRDHHDGDNERAASGADGAHHNGEEVSLPQAINASASRSVEVRPLSPARRTKASPAPTAQDLIQSVQVSADRRPCGCERPIPSPERWHRHRTTPSRSTASPLPTPVPLFDKPMTDFDAPQHKCCDRPTPLSLSSQPAGGDVRATAAPSASPWPTTENIISSIMTSMQDGPRRAREVADDTHEEDGGVSERFSNEEGVVEQREGDAELLTSPTAALPPYSVEEEDETDEAPKSTSTAPTVATHTPSPVPTERQYGQSVVASAEKRRCGRPTPGERAVSLTRRCDRQISAAEEEREMACASASPQPSTHHLLDSLDVSIGKDNAREKSTERVNAGDEENALSGTFADNRAPPPSIQKRDMRTPSPTPTPEHVISSLQASAEKRTRSAAMVVSKSSGDTGLRDSSTDGSPKSTSFQSPMLTPQNVKDSMQKLVDCKQQQQSRSDAQAPHRPWSENGPHESDANCNSSASPIVTAEDVDMSLAALEHDERRKLRSVRGERDFDSPSTPTVNVDGAKSGAAVRGDSALSPQTVVVSPAPSDFLTQSAMFFDCISAPITPSVPSVEIVAVAQDATRRTASSASASTSCVPAQFFELQREISAISEGRSRPRTPPPLRAGERSSPAPQLASPIVEAKGEEDTPRAEASTELAMASPDDEMEAEVLRRSSLLLVQPTPVHQALIQHPHEPVPVAPPPAISPVQVPRTLTPPTCSPQVAVRGDKRLLNDVETGESPLPRPVSLRSQVSLPKQPQPLAVATHSRSPAPTWRVTDSAERPTAWLYEGQEQQKREAEGSQRVAPRQITESRPHRSVAATTVETHDAEEDLFDSRNDWMDLVEPLRPHTITVSPQGGAVVYTTHSPQHGEELSNDDGKHDAREEQTLVSPSSLSRKRSRSARTPPATTRTAVRAAVAAAAASALTPASLALTMDDSVSTEGKSSELLTHTPTSHVSLTPRSSTRGRRSQAEELMAMLPADVAAEVARMESVEEGDTSGETAPKTRMSQGSSGSRLSGLSENDSTSAQMSTISQRVSQRPQRVRCSNDYYIQYLEGIARSSAKKTRAAAGRRMQKAIKKDLATEKRRKGGKVEAVEVLSGAGSADPLRRSYDSEPANMSSEPSASESPYNSEDVTLSPVTPLSLQTRRGGRSQLRVSSRLSAELQQALFGESPTRAVPKGSPRKAAAAAPSKSKKAKKAKKAAATPAKRGTPAKDDARSSSTLPHGSAANATEVKKKPKTLGSGGRAKTVRKFVTAKSMRSVKRGAPPQKKH